jgi:hypothetical protein
VFHRLDHQRAIRVSSGRHSVLPVAISTIVRVWMNDPATDVPPWATMSTVLTQMTNSATEQRVLPAGPMIHRCLRHSFTSGSRLRKVSARRIEAGCFKSWTRPDRKSPGYRVRKPWQPRRRTNTTPETVARLHTTRQASVLKPLNDRFKSRANM